MKKLTRLGLRVILAITVIVAGTITLFLPANEKDSVKAEETISEHSLDREFFCAGNIINHLGTYGKTSEAVIKIITWYGNYAKDRCEFTSRRFEELYKKRALNYFMSGKFEGYNVICGVSKPDEECSRAKQILIYLAPGKDPNQVILGLKNINEGASLSGIRLGGEFSRDPRDIFPTDEPRFLHGAPTTDAPPPARRLF